jgi:hypothetical protein
MIEWNEKQRWKDRNATESRRFGTSFDEDCGERIYLCVESLPRGILIQGGKIRTSFWTKSIALRVMEEECIVGGEEDLELGVLR